ncbi:MAG: prolyl oligopeptidase family serine peptidase [Nocardioides sp.]
MRAPTRLITALASTAVLLAGCSDSDPEAGAADSTAAPSSTPSPTPSQRADSPSGSPSGGASVTPGAGEDSPDSDEPEQTTAPARPVSVLGLAQQRHRGDRLTLGAVRERTAAFTSYDVTYRSRSTTPRGEESYRISGVLNVPSGPGPFPAVVLAHGYIDPAYYVRGQGMTRERGYLAARGYVALHVDYRNHAESDDDPLLQARMRLGYSVDVINAVKALRRSRDVPVNDDRVALFGRSMGGGVILKALVAEPGLVQAAAPWASVSSLEAENFRQFMQDPEDTGVRADLERRYGTPAQNPRFWRENSSRPYFERITEPVLMVHGRADDTCPPPWATATQGALAEAGVDSRLEWYDDGHAFGPAFEAAMARTVLFFDRWLG